MGKLTKAAAAVLGLLLVTQQGWAVDKGEDDGFRYTYKEWCGHVCKDGNYSHDLNYTDGQDRSCGPAAAAALLANLGCKTLRRKFSAAGSLPMWGSTPGTMTEMINHHIAKGDGCYRVRYEDMSFRNQREYFNIIEALTDKGYSVAALIEWPSSDKPSLHWVVVGDIERSKGSCEVAFYTWGYKYKVRCAEFGAAAKNGYAWPFVSRYTVVVPFKNIK